MERDHLAEGFRGQVLHFAPASVRAALAGHPLTAELSAPDIGWFPRAHGHYRERLKGAEQHILIYCRAGGGWYEIDECKRVLSRGQALLIPRGKPHRYGANDENPWSIHWAHFVGNAAPLYSKKVSPPEYTTYVSPVTEKQFESLCRECYQILGKGHSLNNYMLVAHIVRHELGILFFKKGLIDSNNAPQAHDLTATIEFMRTNLDRNLSLSELAKRACISPSRYSAIFKEQTGTSPVEYHIGLRIQAACRLLTTTALSIKEICNCLGYNDTCYFSRLFGKVMGISPSAYRQDARG